MHFELQYLNLIDTILKNGILKENRTGVSAYTIAHTMLQHDMQNGFPLLTTKKMGIKSISAELEFFIKGLTDKQWLKDRKCSIWNEWCNPKKIPNDLTDEERKAYQLTENDLGPIYGYQWRNFNSSGYDQLKHIVNTLKTNPNDRRMVCSSWNPLEMDSMALPPCHVLWHVTVIGNKLNLSWFQRSCDVGAGVPYNIASYAILLKLLAKESNLEEGIITGFLSDVHIYENHIEQMKEQLTRSNYDEPQLEILNFTNIFDWKYTDLKLYNYNYHPKIYLPIAV
jgi:thymidylate synthase